MEGAYFERIWEHVPADARPERFELRRDFLLERVRAGQRVLDLGCGDGAFSVALLDAGARPVGVDVAAEPLRRAAARSPALELQRVEGGELPFAEESFDAAWLGDVLEHVHDVVGLVADVFRVLRRGGLLLSSTPDHPRHLLVRLAVQPRAFEAHFDPRSDHVRFFTRRSLATLLRDAGFRSIDTRARGGALLAQAQRP